MTRYLIGAVLGLVAAAGAANAGTGGGGVSARDLISVIPSGDNPRMCTLCPGRQPICRCPADDKRR